MFYYTKAIESNNKNYKAYANRGNYYMMRGEYLDAINDISSAIEIESKEKVRPYISIATKLFWFRSVCYFRLDKYYASVSDLIKFFYFYLIRIRY